MANLLPLLFAVGAGAVLLSKKKKSSSGKASGKIPEDYFNGYFSPGATVGAATGLSDIEKPVKLSGIVMRDVDGNMHDVAEAEFFPDGSWATNTKFPWPKGPEDAKKFPGNALDRVVTNFYGPGSIAFGNEVMDEFINGDRPTDAKDPAVARAVAMDVLKRLRSKVKWDQAEPGTVEGMVLDGATVIARIVQQNLPGA